MFGDKSNKIMIFATGNIYISTGTSSKDVKDKGFADSFKRELAEIKARHSKMRIRRVRKYKI